MTPQVLNVCNIFIFSLMLSFIVWITSLTLTYSSHAIRYTSTRDQNILSLSLPPIQTRSHDNYYYYICIYIYNIMLRHNFDLLDLGLNIIAVFIRKYAQYLEEKVLVYRALRMEFEKDPALLKNLSVEESFVRLPKIQRQLDALINCQVSTPLKTIYHIILYRRCTVFNFLLSLDRRVLRL